MTPSLPGDPPADSGWNVCHDKPEWPSPKLDYYWDHDVANLGGKTQTAVFSSLAMARPQEVERLARGARSPCHSAVQVP